MNWFLRTQYLESVRLPDTFSLFDPYHLIDGQFFFVEKNKFSRSLKEEVQHFFIHLVFVLGC